MRIAFESMNTIMLIGKRGEKKRPDYRTGCLPHIRGESLVVVCFVTKPEEEKKKEKERNTYLLERRATNSNNKTIRDISTRFSSPSYLHTILTL